MLVTQDQFEKKLLLCHGMYFDHWSFLVHFGALHERPHDTSVLDFHSVNVSTHQELLHLTSPTFLAQFVQEILI